MADGTLFKRAMRCDVELPYKLMVNVEYKKVQYRNRNGNYRHYNKIPKFLRQTYQVSCRSGLGAYFKAKSVVWKKVFKLKLIYY